MISIYVRTNALLEPTMARTSRSRIWKTSSLFVDLATLAAERGREREELIGAVRAVLERAEDEGKESADETAEIWRTYVSLVVFILLFASLTGTMS